MIKTRIKALEEIYDKTLVIIIDAEVQIEYFQKQDPKAVVLQRPVKKFNALAKREFVEMVSFTAEMLVTMEKTKLTENNKILKIVKEKIRKEEGGHPLATPTLVTPTS